MPTEQQARADRLRWPLCLGVKCCPQSFLSDRPAAALGTAGAVDLWRLPLAHRILVSRVLAG
jgi:hypothetical protein